MSLGKRQERQNDYWDMGPMDGEGRREGMDASRNISKQPMVYNTLTVCVAYLKVIDLD